MGTILPHDTHDQLLRDLKEAKTSFGLMCGWETHLRWSGDKCWGSLFHSLLVLSQGEIFVWDTLLLNAKGAPFKGLKRFLTAKEVGIPELNLLQKSWFKKFKYAK